MNLKPLRAIGLAVLCVFCLSAYKWVTVLARTPDPVAPSFSFKDERPEQQLKSGFESLMISNCAYGAIRVGDTEPAASVLVQDMLAARMNPLLAGRSVVLRNFTLHTNNAQGLRTQVGAMYTGLIRRKLNDQFKLGCSPDDLRGSYLATEVEPRVVPVILVLDVAIDGQDFHGRCVLPSPAMYPPRKGTDAESKAKWNETVDRALSCAFTLIETQASKKFSTAEIAADGQAPAQTASPSVSDIPVTEPGTAPEPEKAAEPAPVSL